MFLTRNKRFALYSFVLLGANWALIAFLAFRLYSMSRAYARLGGAVAAVVQSLDAVVADGRLCATAATTADDNGQSAPRSRVLGCGRLTNWAYADIQEPLFVPDDGEGGGHYEWQTKRYYVRREAGKGGAPTSEASGGIERSDR